MKRLCCSGKHLNIVISTLIGKIHLGEEEASWMWTDSSPPNIAACSHAKIYGNFMLEGSLQHVSRLLVYFKTKYVDYVYNNQDILATQR